MNNAKRSIEFIDNTTVVIPCQINGEYRLDIPTAALEAYYAGASLADVAPDMPQCDVYALMTGVTPAEMAVSIEAQRVRQGSGIGEPEEFNPYSEIDMLDQAVEAFMDERRSLIETLTDADTLIRDLIGCVNDRDETIAQQEAQLITAATFVGKARNKLASWGITIDVCQITGDPMFNVDFGQLTAAFTS